MDAILIMKKSFLTVSYKNFSKNRGNEEMMNREKKSGKEKGKGRKGERILTGREREQEGERKLF